MGSFFVGFSKNLITVHFVSFLSNLSICAIVCVSACAWSPICSSSMGGQEKEKKIVHHEKKEKGTKSKPHIYFKLIFVVNFFFLLLPANTSIKKPLLLPDVITMTTMDYNM